MKERIHWIDIAKGIAIICVFLGHTITTEGVLSSFIYLFHMPLFFMLSGYCFSAKRDFGPFVLNKLKTVILPIFTLGLTGSVLTALAAVFIQHQSVDWKWVFLNPIVQYKEHSLLWYLASLFVAIIIFYVIVKLTKDKPVPIILISLGLGIISYAVIEIFGITLPWDILTSLIALTFIAIGYLIKKCDFTDKLSRPWILPVSLAVCAGAGYLNIRFFGGSEMHTQQFGNLLLFYVSAIAGCIMVMSFSAVVIKKSKVLEYFGRNTLIFYALEPIQYFVNFALKTADGVIHFTSSHLLSFAATIIAVAIICLLSSAAAYIINRFLPFLIGKPYNKKSPA